MNDIAVTPPLFGDARIRKRRWAMLAVTTIFAQAILWAISEPPELFSDFYKAYFPAGELIVTDGLTAAWPFREEEAAVNFVNIPIIAWLFAPFAALGEPVAGFVFLAVGILAVLATVGIFRNIITEPSAFIIVAGLFAINGPLINSMREGNTTHFVLFMIVGGIYLIGRHAPFAAGVLFGLCAVLKLPLLLLGLYFVLRRQWYIVFGAAIAIMGTVGVSVLVFGFEPHQDWYRSCIAPFLGKVIPAFNVQSIDGFLMRLSTGAGLLHEWVPIAPGLLHQVARYPILLALFASAVIAVLYEKHVDETRICHTKGFAIILALAMISSPLSWTHYYLLLLLPFGLYVSGALDMPTDRITRWLMVSAMVLSSLPVVDFNLKQGFVAEVIAVTVVSLPLLGGLLLFTALVRGTWLARDARHA